MVQVQGLSDQPLPAVAILGAHPTVKDNGRVLLEKHIFDDTGICYGKLIPLKFLHKLRDKKMHIDVPTLAAAIPADAKQAHAWLRQHQPSATSATNRMCGSGFLSLTRPTLTSLRAFHGNE